MFFNIKFWRCPCRSKSISITYSLFKWNKNKKCSSKLKNLQCFITKVPYISMLWWTCHYCHKFNGSRFDNIDQAKFTFHRFVWNKYGCHSSACVIWTLILCALFRQECHMPICIVKHICCMSVRVVYTRKWYTWLSCLKNAWHLFLTNTNL